MKATLSILGLLEMDPTILDGMTIPNGLSLDTLKNNIILECAELEVLYSAPSFFRWAVDAWSLKENPTWEKMFAALQIEYNPLENYDRQETWSENGSHSTTGNRSESWTDTHEGENASTSSSTTSGEENKTSTDTTSREENTTMSGTEETDVSGTKNGTTAETENTSADHFVYGYNDNAQVKQSSDTGTRTTNGTTTETDTGTTEKTTSGTGKTTTTGTDTGTGKTTTTGTASGSASGTDSATDERSGTIEDTNTGTTSGTRSGRVHGNIGVVSSQQMLRQEFELAQEVNMYNIITRSFRNRFCLLIY